jgi:hypothetical protein
MDTVIGCQNCEMKDFVLKCAQCWSAWLVGLGRNIWEFFIWILVKRVMVIEGG